MLSNQLLVDSKAARREGVTAAESILRADILNGVGVDGVRGSIPFLLGGHEQYQGAAKGVRQKQFDHLFSFSGRFRSLFGHFF